MIRQVHTAVCGLTTSWWLNRPQSQHLINAIAYRLKDHQTQNAAARRSHRKRTIRRDHQLGIKLTEATKCHWPTS